MIGLITSMNIIYYHNNKVNTHLKGSDKIMLSVKRLRFDNEMTQLDLSFLTGLNQGAISHLEGKKPVDMRVSTLISLCKAFGITPNDFLEYPNIKKK